MSASGRSLSPALKRALPQYRHCRKNAEMLLGWKFHHKKVFQPLPFTVSVSLRLSAADCTKYNTKFPLCTIFALFPVLAALRVLGLTFFLLPLYMFSGGETRWS